MGNVLIQHSRYLHIQSWEHYLKGEGHDVVCKNVPALAQKVVKKQSIDALLVEDTYSSKGVDALRRIDPDNKISHRYLVTDRDVEEVKGDVAAAEIGPVDYVFDSVQEFNEVPRRIHRDLQTGS